MNTTFEVPKIATHSCKLSSSSLLRYCPTLWPHISKEAQSQHENFMVGSINFIWLDFPPYPTITIYLVPFRYFYPTLILHILSLPSILINSFLGPPSIAIVPIIINIQLKDFYISQVFQLILLYFQALSDGVLQFYQAISQVWPLILSQL